MKQAWIQLLPKSLRSKLDEGRDTLQIISNISWLFAERGLQMSLGLFVSISIARYLGPDKFGTLSYALAFSALMQPLSVLGLNAILTRDIVREPDAKDEILCTAFILRFIGGLLSFFVVASIVWFLHPDDSVARYSITILSLGNIFQAFAVIDFWFQSKVLSKYVVISKSLVLLTSAGIKLTLIFSEASLNALIIVLATELIFTNACLIVPYHLLGNSLTNWRFRLSRGKALLSKSWPLILSSFGTIIYLKIDQIMLGEMVSKEAVGNYAVAAKISEIWYFIPTAVASSVFPSLLKSRENNIKNYKNKLQKLYDNLASLALMIALPITLVANPVITMLYGNAYQEAGIILSIHIWASVFIFMRAALSKWLIAEDLFIFSLVTHGLGAIVNALLNLFLIPNFGGIGAAIATLISYATASYFALFVHSRTVETARMMTLSLIFPIRFLLKKTSNLT